MDSTSTTSMLLDSTRPVTNGRGGSVCTDMDVGSDMTSEISSASALNHGSLADYQLGRLLGRGKYSQVYLATEIRTGQMVAIKRVEIFDMMDSASRQACVKEVKILQNVEHPNIVKCFRSFLSDADNELVIVLEWAEGGDLGHIIKQRQEAGRAFSEEEVWNQFQQVCNALRHMHDRRMMHRDLKPSNIFVTAGGDLKLGDLGLSRYFSSRTLQAQTTVGTPYYMSPEVVRGQPYDFSSDIWSLGCLLYELIVLRNPFYKENQSLYMLGKLIQNCQYDPLPPSVPEILRELVSCMLQPQPQCRPTIAQIADFVNSHIAARHTQAVLLAQQPQGPLITLSYTPQGMVPAGNGNGCGMPQLPLPQQLHQSHPYPQHPHPGGSTGGAPPPLRHQSSVLSQSVMMSSCCSSTGGSVDLGITGYSIQLSGRGANSNLPR